MLYLARKCSLRTLSALARRQTSRSARCGFLRRAWSSRREGRHVGLFRSDSGSLCEVASQRTGVNCSHAVGRAEGCLGLAGGADEKLATAFGSPRSAMLLPARPCRAVADGCRCPHWRPCCARVHADIEPSPAGHVPSGSWWAWGEPLAGSSLAGPAVQSLAITPGKVSRHRSRGTGFGVVNW